VKEAELKGDRDREGREIQGERRDRAGQRQRKSGKERERHGRGVQDGEHMYTRGGFMSMYGKNHCNIVK